MYIIVIIYHHCMFLYMHNTITILYAYVYMYIAMCLPVGITLSDVVVTAVIADDVAIPSSVVEDGVFVLSVVAVDVDMVVAFSEVEGVVTTTADDVVAIATDEVVAVDTMAFVVVVLVTVAGTTSKTKIANYHKVYTCASI